MHNPAPNDRMFRPYLKRTYMIDRSNGLDDAIKFVKKTHPNFLQFNFKGLTITRDVHV